MVEAVLTGRLGGRDVASPAVKCLSAWLKLDTTGAGSCLMSVKEMHTKQVITLLHSVLAKGLLSASKAGKGEVRRKGVGRGAEGRTQAIGGKGDGTEPLGATKLKGAMAVVFPLGALCPLRTVRAFPFAGWPHGRAPSRPGRQRGAGLLLC